MRYSCAAILGIACFAASLTSPVFGDDQSMVGVWEQEFQLDGRWLYAGRYEVFQRNHRFEMRVVDRRCEARNAVYTNGLSNVAVNGNHWTFDSDWGRYGIGKFSLRKESPGVFLGASSSRQMNSIAPNRWTRVSSHSVSPALCVAYRDTKRIKWFEGTTPQTCDLISSAATDETVPGGPTPLGEYLIDLRYQHAIHHIDWYKLHPRKEDDSRYYDYVEKNNFGRNAMGIHPGRASDGCVTIRSTTSPYDVDLNWKRLRTYLDAHRYFYLRGQYTGFLFVVSTPAHQSNFAGRWSAPGLPSLTMTQTADGRVFGEQDLAEINGIVVGSDLYYTWLGQVGHGAGRMTLNGVTIAINGKNLAVADQQSYSYQLRRD